MGELYLDGTELRGKGLAAAPDDGGALLEAVKQLPRLLGAQPLELVAQRLQPPGPRASALHVSRL